MYLLSLVIGYLKVPKMKSLCDDDVMVNCCINCCNCYKIFALSHMQQPEVAKERHESVTPDAHSFDRFVRQGRSISYH